MPQVVEAAGPSDGGQYCWMPDPSAEVGPSNRGSRFGGKDKPVSWWVPTQVASESIAQKLGERNSPSRGRGLGFGGAELPTDFTE